MTVGSVPRLRHTEDMTTSCSVCAHEQREDINHALISGVSVRDAAGRFDASKSAVDRHRRRCLAPRMASAIARADEITVERLQAYASGLLESALWGMLRARQDEAWADHRAYLSESRRVIETLAKLGGIGRPDVHVDARTQTAIVAQLGSLSEDELRALARDAIDGTARALPPAAQGPNPGQINAHPTDGSSRPVYGR